MNKKASILFIAASLIALGAALQAQERESALKARFLDEPFVDGKAKAARDIAALRTPASRELLLELFALPSSWDKAGAFFGLFALGDASIDGMLAEAYIDEWGMESFVGETVALNPERFLPNFASLYLLPERASDREAILQAIGTEEGEKVRLFLEKAVLDPSDVREQAFRAYSLKRRKGDAPFVRSLVADAELKAAALARLSEIGGPEDLALFEREFFADGDPEIRLPALQAASTWGGTGLKARLFAAALANEEALARESACLLFRDIRSPDLEALAGKVADAFDAPFAALAAAEYLCGYGSQEAIALAVPALRADYRPEVRRPGFGDWVAAFFTLGISRVMDDYSASRGASDFIRRKEELARLLSSLAGRKIPADYGVWEDWCISQGLSVGGRNILQELLSSRPEERVAVLLPALALLGWESEGACVKANPDYAALDPFGRSLWIAKALRAKGYPKGFR